MLNQLFPAEALGGNMPRAFPEAVLAYEETAKGGDPVSAAGMGTMHLYGWGLPQSYELARTFFFSCRNRGHPRGFTGMGILLANGWGGEKKDYEEAKKMLRRGSELVRMPPWRCCCVYVCVCLGVLVRVCQLDARLCA